MNPAFHVKLLEQSVSTFDTQARILVDLLREKELNNDGFDSTKYIRYCTLDVICGELFYE